MRAASAGVRPPSSGTGRSPRPSRTTSTTGSRSSSRRGWVSPCPAGLIGTRSAARPAARAGAAPWPAARRRPRRPPAPPAGRGCRCAIDLAGGVAVEDRHRVAAVGQARRLLPLPGVVGAHELLRVQRHVLAATAPDGSGRTAPPWCARPGPAPSSAASQQPHPLEVGERVRGRRCADGADVDSSCRAPVSGLVTATTRWSRLAQGDREQLEVLGVHRLEAPGDAGEPQGSCRRSRPRAIALRWISTVPAGIRRLRARRNSFSSGRALQQPGAAVHLHGAVGDAEERLVVDHLDQADQARARRGAAASRTGRRAARPVRPVPAAKRRARV